MRFLRLMKQSEIKPIWWSPEQHARSARFIKLCRMFLLIALLTLVLSGCSKAVSIQPMPLPPANLASNCPELPPIPTNFTDPERLIWEVEIVAKYGDCALRHRKTIEAWEEAVKKSKK